MNLQELPQTTKNPNYLFKILGTIFSCMIFGYLFIGIQRTFEMLTKYAALQQFDNSETSTQIYKFVSSLGSAPYLLAIIMIYVVTTIWRK